MRAQLKYAGINGTEHCASIDLRRKISATHLKSPTDGRGVPLSRVIIAMLSKGAITRLVRMFTAMRRQIECLLARDGTSNTLEVNRLSTGFLRASHLERVVVAGYVHAARFVAPQP